MWPEFSLYACEDTSTTLVFCLFFEAKMKHCSCVHHIHIFLLVGLLGGILRGCFTEHRAEKITGC